MSSDFENVLSVARLSTYQKAMGGNLPKAVRLYQWNADVSGAFLPVLQLLEVTIRNAISEAITLAYGKKWAWEQKFLLSLPNNDEQRKPLEKKSQKYQDLNKIVADMNFIFWQKMLTSRFSKNIWENHLQKVLPNIGNTDLATLYNEIDQIRKLRNRIAHHEPIFHRNLADDLSLILKVIGYRCSTTQNWAKSLETVTSLLVRKPLC